MQSPIQFIYSTVKEHCKNDTTGHDWWHIHRVTKLSLTIGQQENADIEQVELAALLHDLDDWKLSTSNGNYPNARKLLSEIEYDPRKTEAVIGIIKQVSFKGAKVDTKPTSPEAMVVQDADRLDAIGAIGVARAFAYGGSKKRPIYEPNVSPQLHYTFEQYKQAEGTTINHFYEKLLLLKDMLNTPTAVKIAEERHNFMLMFLEQFYKEWNGGTANG